MTSQHTISHRHKAIAGTALIGLGLVILFVVLDGFAVRLTINLIGVAARAALVLLPSIASAAWQILQAYAFDHQRSSPCPLQMLVSLWPLLRVLAGAA